MNSTLETTEIVFEKINYDCIIKGDGGIEYYNRADEPQQTFIKIECNPDMCLRIFLQHIWKWEKQNDSFPLKYQSGCIQQIYPIFILFNIFFP